MAEQVQKAADLVKETYKYVGESAKPYVGESIGNAVTATGEYGAAGIQKVGEMAGLQSSKVRALSAACSSGAAYGARRSPMTSFIK